MYTHENNVITSGQPAGEARGALVMLHGRGGSAADILHLTELLQVDTLACYAPQASNHSWYPYSFMAPEIQNQPALDSALEVIAQVVKQVEEDGIPADRTFFLGFSQGACLTLEYVARNAKRYGGIVAFTGGLIGETLHEDRYSGDFSGTPVLLSTGDPDPHVPLSRVEQSADVLKRLGANVTLKVYPGRVHTVSRPEIVLANELIFKRIGDE